MPRILETDWLRAYLEYTKDNETPEHFHLWSGISCLSSVLRKQVWLQNGPIPFYPNTYIVLIAPPGTAPKTTAIRYTEKLLIQIEEMVWGPDAVTQEQLIEIMLRNGTLEDSSMTIHSHEFSSLIQPSGIKMMSFLTDIYDNPPRS